MTLAPSSILDGPARGERAMLRSVALLPLRALRWVVLGLLGWLLALLVAAAIGAAVGFAAGLLAAPWYGWESLAIGPVVGAMLAAHIAPGSCR
ncbi:MAG TPA: hypothetical protein VFO88_06075 [Gaiellaceae bacterium]|nr:hypothetical protein [Gaiellaceae bacterium]